MIMTAAADVAATRLKLKQWIEERATSKADVALATVYIRVLLADEPRRIARESLKKQADQRRK